MVELGRMQQLLNARHLAIGVPKHKGAKLKGPALGEESLRKLASHECPLADAMMLQRRHEFWRQKLSAKSVWPSKKATKRRKQKMHRAKWIRKRAILHQLPSPSHPRHLEQWRPRKHFST